MAQTAATIEHNIAYGIAVEHFSSVEEAAQARQDITDYHQDWVAIMEQLKAVGLNVRANFWTFCPERQRVWLSFLEDKDEPKIPENGIYVTFTVDMKTQTVEARNWGCIDLTDADRRKSYLYMCGIDKAVKAAGGKWFRKQRYTSKEQLADKILKFHDAVKAALDKTTTGYPYKQMAVNIY